MELPDALAGAAGSLWDTVYRALGGVAGASTLITALIFLLIAVVVFNSTESFVLDVVAIGVMAASVFIGLNSIYKIRALENGTLLTEIVAIVLALVYLIKSIGDGNTKLKIIDFILIAVLFVALGFNLSSLDPDSRIGRLAVTHIQKIDTFWSDVFNDTDAQLSNN